MEYDKFSLWIARLDQKYKFYQPRFITRSCTGLKLFLFFFSETSNDVVGRYTTVKPTMTMNWRLKRVTSSSSWTRRQRTKTGWRDTYSTTPTRGASFPFRSFTCSQIEKTPDKNICSDTSFLGPVATTLLRDSHIN